MKGLLQNFQPIIFSLIGIFALSISYPKTIRKWKESPPHLPTRVPLRIAFGLGILLIICFTMSKLLAPDSKFVWVNTFSSFFLLALYLVKIMIDLRKYSKSVDE